MYQVSEFSSVSKLSNTPLHKWCTFVYHSSTLRLLHLLPIVSLTLGLFESLMRKVRAWGLAGLVSSPVCAPAHLTCDQLQAPEPRPL